jgi:hypothetical protein
VGSDRFPQRQIAGDVRLDLAAASAASAQAERFDGRGRVIVGTTAAEDASGCHSNNAAMPARLNDLLGDHHELCPFGGVVLRQDDGDDSVANFYQATARKPVATIGRRAVEHEGLIPRMWPSVDFLYCMFFLQIESASLCTISRPPLRSLSHSQLE